MQAAAILAQLKMLQDQVAIKQVDHKETDSEACGNDNEEGPSSIRGGIQPVLYQKGYATGIDSRRRIQFP